MTTTCADRDTCNNTHCGTCERHTEALHCPTCVGKVRDALTQIEAMSSRLLAEATHRGINSTAATYAGPAADPDIFGRRLALAIDNRLCDCTDDNNDELHPMKCPAAVAYIEDNRDEAHPLWVTGTWDLMVTQHLGHERTQRVTLSGAINYLKANLTDLANDPDFPFEEMARDLRACRSALEEALNDGIRHTTGEDCATCETPMVKTWGASEDLDGWMCRRCHERLSDAQHELAKRDRLEREEAERWQQGAPDWATAGQIERHMGIKASALSMRVKRDRLATMTRDNHTLYRVSDLGDAG